MNRNGIGKRLLCFSLVFVLSFSTMGFSAVWAEGSKSLDEEGTLAGEVLDLEVDVELDEETPGEEPADEDDDESDIAEAEGASDAIVAEDTDATEEDSTGEVADDETAEEIMEEMAFAVLNEDETWQAAWETAKSASDASDMSAVFEMLGAEVMHDFSPSGEGWERIRLALYQQRGEFNQESHTLGDFKNAVTSSVMFEHVDDFLYYGDSYVLLYRLLQEYDYYEFNTLNQDEQYAVTANLRLFNGYYINKEGERDGQNTYGDVTDFKKVYINAINSVKEASKDEVTCFTDGTTEIDRGQYKQLADYTVAGEDHKLIFESMNAKILEAGSGETIDDGIIYGINDGQTTIVYLRVNSSTGAITNYSLIELMAYDRAPATASVYRPEAGHINMMILTFDKAMNYEINERVELKEVATEIRVGDTVIEELDGEVLWITPRVAKVVFPPTDIAVGETFSLTFAETVMTFREIPMTGLSVESKVAVADTFAPVGKIVPRTGSVKELEIVFNELIAPEGKEATQANVAISSITLGSNAEERRVVKPTTLSWSSRDGRDVLTVGLQPVTVGEIEYFEITYTDLLKDYAGNPIDNSPKAVAIGGGINLGSALTGTTDIINHIRELAGGKTPKVAILSSSDSPYEDAWDYYYENTAGIQAAYGFALFGFEPVIAEITCDTYDDPEIIARTMASFEDCTAVFGPGGDQAMNSRSYLNDDGSDTELMRAMRQVFHSGGVISGSSAGDHSLSNPMITGGNSSEALRGDAVEVITVDDYENQGGGLPLIMAGYGFVSEYGMTDSHVDARARFGRLLVALKHTEQEMGIGVAENTAIAIVDGVGTVYGVGGVTLSDVSEAEYVESSIYAARGIRVSHLTAGDQYDFNAKTVRSSKSLAVTTDTELMPSANVFPDSISGAHTTGVEALMRELIQSTAAAHYGMDQKLDDEDADFVPTLLFLKDERTSGHYQADHQFTVSNMLLHVDTYRNLAEQLPPIPPTRYPVIVLTPQNGNIISPENSAYRAGDTVTLSAKAASGYHFERWQVVYTDDAEETVAVANPTAIETSFVMPEAAVTISATFRRTTTSGGGGNRGQVQPGTDPDGSTDGTTDGEGKGGTSSAATFTDVTESHWAFEFIAYLSERGYVAGKTATSFAPEDSITRAEFITILARMSQETLPASYQGAFTDLSSGAYYESAVAWGVAAGIVNGTSATTFSPDQPIRRQEIAAMIQRYAAHQGLTLPQSNQAVTFTDNGQIESYALEAVNAMQQAGIINGYEDGSFKPLANASRAETARMLYGVDILTL